MNPGKLLLVYVILSLIPIIVLIGAFITSVLSPVLVKYENDTPLWISLALSIVGPILFLISCSVIACSKTVNIQDNSFVSIDARKIVDYALIALFCDIILILIYIYNSIIYVWYIIKSEIDLQPKHSAAASFAILSTIFLSVHLIIVSYFVYKYSKESKIQEQKLYQQQYVIKKSNSQLTNISTITSDTL